MRTLGDYEAAQYGEVDDDSDEEPWERGRQRQGQQQQTGANNRRQDKPRQRDQPERRTNSNNRGTNNEWSWRRSNGQMTLTSS